MELSAQTEWTDGPSFYIRSITFTGNRRTKERIMLRELNIAPGDQIQKDELDEMLHFNKRRLLNMQLFSQVDFTMCHDVNDTIDLQFGVNEIFFWIPKPVFSLADRNFNVWWYEQNNRLDRTNIGLELTRLNFRGRNERIGGTVQVGYNKFFDVFYKIPYVDKRLKHGIGLSATYQTGREINFKTDSNKIKFFHRDEYPYRNFQTEFTYTYRPAYAWIHEVNLNYNYLSITEELFNKNPDFFHGKKKLNFFELKYTLRFNNTDVRVYPIHGLETKIQVSKKGLGFDKDVNQFILYNETSFYKRLVNNLSSALHFKGRITFAKDLPYYFNRALGFKNQYVRGYEYYVIDGSHYALLRADLRYKLIDRTIYQPFLKFMKYIPTRVYVKMYDDMGYVYSRNPGNSFLNNKWLNGYGAGVDIVISYYLKLRLEYSFNHLGQNDLFLHSTKE